MFGSDPEEEQALRTLARAMDMFNKHIKESVEIAYPDPVVREELQSMFPDMTLEQILLTELFPEVRCRQYSGKRKRR